MATKLVVAILLCFAVSSLVSAQGPERRRRFREEAQQCRLDRLQARPPSRRIESEGGISEIWDESEEEFQCAGVAAMRSIIRPNSLTVPMFQSSPMLIYVEQGITPYKPRHITLCFKRIMNNWLQMGWNRGRVHGAEFPRVRRDIRGTIIPIFKTVFKASGASSWRWQRGRPTPKGAQSPPW